VAPSASKREQILEYLLSTVIPSVVAGASYTHTVKTIERGRRNIMDMADCNFPAVFIATTAEKRRNLTGNQLDASLQVVLVGYVKNSKTSPGASGTGTQKDLDKLIQDVTRAVEADPTQGNIVKWTEITNIDTDDGDLTPIGGFVMSVTFEYVAERAIV
jgi:hypothetical protein